jgi:hypothetical protein
VDIDQSSSGVSRALQGAEQQPWPGAPPVLTTTHVPRHSQCPLRQDWPG